MLLHQYAMLSTSRSQTCAWKQLTFVFAPRSLVRQVIFADLGQAWLSLDVLVPMHGGQLGWGLLDNDSWTTMSGDWLSMKLWDEWAICFSFLFSSLSLICLAWFQERQRVAAYNHWRNRLEIAKNIISASWYWGRIRIEFLFKKHELVNKWWI